MSIATYRRLGQHRDLLFKLLNEAEKDILSDVDRLELEQTQAGKKLLTLLSQEYPDWASKLSEEHSELFPVFRSSRVNNATRILLVDHHEVVRLGLKSLLGRNPQFEVVAEASSAKEAIEKTNALKPDVVVMEIRLPGTSGIEACEQIVSKHPDTKVIMLTSYADDEMLFAAIRAGASGYIMKQLGSNDLVKALEAVSRGEALLDPALTQRVFHEVRRVVKEEEASAFQHLSQQEKHVLLLVSEGKTNREIAKQLFLGEGTVRNYVSSILSKLGVNNLEEAAVQARDLLTVLIKDSGLSEIEMQILELDKQGHSSESIAKLLKTDIDTIYSRRSEAIRKLQKQARRIAET
jgi:DNA-binding NarL/FixJ family response regulator